MATPRAVISRALRLIKAMAPGDEPQIDDLTVGLEALHDLVTMIHEARGPMCDIDVTADYTPGENQRVRVQAGDTVSITLPNAVPCFNYVDYNDYGFIPPAFAPTGGTTGAADGVQFRQPRDGTRIEIVGRTQGLYFYRADLNQWMDAANFGLDDELPFNERLTEAVSALLARSLIDQWPDTAPPSPTLTRRIAAGNVALLMRTGTARSPVRADYL